MKFLKDFEKQMGNEGLLVGNNFPPRYWHSTGNYALNRVLSGSFSRGIPQGRLTGLAGPSGSGKSFIAANIMREAQKDGAIILAVDSENALDADFVSAIGVDPDKDYYAVQVSTIPQASKTISAFLKGYRKEYGEDPDAPKLLIVLDSLDMLMTESEMDHYSKGDTVGDQGQQVKQLKAMLRTFTQDIKLLNVAMLATKQVYAATQAQILKGEGVWVINDAIRYSMSQIALFTRLKLKDTTTKDVTGIRLKAEGFKTRFTRPFQTVTIEVPYETGMDPYYGLLDAALGLGVVTQAGARYTIAGESESWFAKNIEPHKEKILAMCEEKSNGFVQAILEEGEEEDKTGGPSAKSKRTKRALSAVDLATEE